MSSNTYRCLGILVGKASVYEHVIIEEIEIFSLPCPGVS